MSDFLFKTTASFTLVSTTDGQSLALSLDPKVIEEVRAQGSDVSDMGAVLEALGRDAAALLEGLGALAGVGDMLSAAYAEAGMEGLAGALSEMAAGRTEGVVGDMMGASPNDSFLPEGFETANADKLADLLDFGLPGKGGAEGGDTGDTDESGDIFDAVADLVGSQTGLMEDNQSDFDRVVEKGVAWGAAGAAAGFLVGWLSPEPVSNVVTTGGGAMVGFVVGVGTEGLEVLKEKLTTDDDSSMPADPNGEGGGLTRAEFKEIFGEDDPLRPDPTTTLPGSPDDAVDGGTPPSEEDLNDLDPYTQPGTADDEFVFAVDLPETGPLDNLDPWINPGEDVRPEGGFVDGFGGAPTGGGENFVIANGGGLGFQASVELEDSFITFPDYY